MEEFLECCKNGRLKQTKKIYENDDFDLYINNEKAFFISCLHGHLKVAKWLYSLGNVDIHNNNEKTFCFSCGNGHLEVAKWLYSLGNVDIHICNEFVFRLSCKNGHLEVVKWLYSLNPNHFQELLNKYIDLPENIQSWKNDLVIYKQTNTLTIGISESTTSHRQVKHKTVHKEQLPTELPPGFN